VVAFHVCGVKESQSFDLQLTMLYSCICTALLLPLLLLTPISYLKRAIKTCWHALEQTDQMHIPIVNAWQLNERHYGALTGLDKQETVAKHGKEQVLVWRRSYDIPPPPLDTSSEHYPGNDPKYAALSKDQLPVAESLATTLDRVLPYWEKEIAPRIKAGEKIIVSAYHVFVSCWQCCVGRPCCLNCVVQLLCQHLLAHTDHDRHALQSTLHVPYCSVITALQFAPSHAAMHTLARLELKLRALLSLALVLHTGRLLRTATL
jgi:Histidine phosphatase superfamily (branch 1)